MRLGQLAELIERACVSWPLALPYEERVQSPYYHLFYLLARDMAPCVAVELGVEKGRGSMALSLGSPDCRVYGFDPHHHAEVDALVARCPNFTYSEHPSLPPSREYPDGIDILHIDTEHSYANAKNEFGHYRQYLNPGAVVCFDDVHAMDDGVLQAIAELRDYPRILDDRLHPVCGYGVLWIPE